MEADHEQRHQPPIPIILGLNLELEQLAASDKSLHQLIHEEISLSLDHLLTVLGIPGKSKVQIKALPGTTSGGELLRLSINDRKCHHPEKLVQHVYSYVTGFHSGLSASKKQILSWLCSGNDNQEAASPADVVEFLKLVCLEITKIQPSVLFGKVQFEAYLSKLPNQVDEPVNQDKPSYFNMEALQRILSCVVDLRIPIADTEIISEVLQKRFATGLSPEEIIEHLITALKSDTVGIQISTAYLKQLTSSGSEDDQNFFTLMRDGLFYELGLRFPDFYFETNEMEKPDSFAFRINHLTTLPHIGLPPGKVLVNDTIDRLQLLNIPGTPAINPVQGNECSLIDMRFQKIAESAGLTTWNQLGYLILCFSTELRQYGTCFVHIQDLEESLNQLKTALPDLVKGVQEKFSLEQITQVLRSLIAEELSIRNLRLILEQISNYDYIVADSSKYIIFDDRLPLPGEPGKTWFEHIRNLTSFTRVGFKKYISHKYMRGQNALTVYLLDPEIERLLLNHQQKGTNLPEHQLDKILETLQVEVDALPMTSFVPVILTTIDIRLYFREIISSRFPKLSVLSYQELSPDLNIQPIARISVDNHDWSAKAIEPT